jgi:hypothetical protein
MTFTESNALKTFQKLRKSQYPIPKAIYFWDYWLFMIK